MPSAPDSRVKSSVSYISTVLTVSYEEGKKKLFLKMFAVLDMTDAESLMVWSF